MNAILRYLCFFPSITFGLITAEVLPYALAYSSMHMKTLRLALILFVFLIIGSALYSVLTAYHTSIASEAFRSALAYLNPLIIFAVILQLPRSEYFKFIPTCYKVFTLFCILLVLQFSGFFTFLDPIFKTLIPRSSASSLGFRGITLLSTEPSRASVEFIFVYLVVRTLWLPKRFKTMADIVVGLVILLVFKAATSIFLYGVFIALFNKVLLLSVVPFALYLIAVNTPLVSGRALVLINSLLSLPFEDALFLFVNTSGNRAISVMAAVEYGMAYPFGGGVGNWKETSIDALLLTGYDYTTLNYFNAEWKKGELHFRATGYMMNLMMDLGVIGIICATTLIYHLSKPFLKNSNTEKKVFSLFLINIFFVGSVGAPVPWIAAAILLRSKEYLLYSPPNEGAPQILREEILL